MLNFAPDKFSGFAEAFQAHVDQAMVTARAAEPKVFNPVMGPEGREVERKTITAGALGRKCIRAGAYEYHRYSKDPGREPNGSMLRIFARGHAAEAGMAEILKTAGFEILTKTAYGKQFRFDQLPYEDGKGRIKGMADGVITGGPAVLGIGYPCLWENKEVGTKKFTKFKKKGVREISSEYFVQVQLLMGYLGLTQHPTLFTAKCADTQEIYAELIAFDASEAQKASDKGVRIVQSNSPDDFPRIHTDPNFFECKMCDFHDRCWEAQQQTTTQAPAWLSNAVEGR